MMIVHHFPVSFGLIPDQLIMMNIMPHFHGGRVKMRTILLRISAAVFWMMSVRYRIELLDFFFLSHSLGHFMDSRYAILHLNPAHDGLVESIHKYRTLNIYTGGKEEKAFNRPWPF